MQTLQKNKQVFYFARLIGKTVIVDEYGNETGEYELHYDEPMRCEGNISAAKGETEVKQFGENLDYDKVIFIDKTTAMMLTESARLWIDTLPEGENENVPHDYIVKKIAVSLNTKKIAVKKVLVSEGGQEG